MSLITTYVLLTASIIFNGLLAGGNIDRAFIQMPAWVNVGSQAWASYSRHADLENGLYLYPLEAIGGALLTIGAAISFFYCNTSSYSVALPLYLSVILVIAGLLATIKAAPIMMSLRHISSDEKKLKRHLKVLENGEI